MKANDSGELSPFGIMIASQGPQEGTQEAFWDMVVQNNVKRIVTLCCNIGKPEGNKALSHIDAV